MSGSSGCDTKSGGELSESRVVCNALRKLGGIVFVFTEMVETSSYSEPLELPVDLGSIVM